MTYYFKNSIEQNNEEFKCCENEIYNHVMLVKKILIYLELRVMMLDYLLFKSKGLPNIITYNKQICIILTIVKLYA